MDEIKRWTIWACPDCAAINVHPATCGAYPGEPVVHGNRVEVVQAADYERAVDDLRVTIGALEHYAPGPYADHDAGLVARDARARLTEGGRMPELPRRRRGGLERGAVMAATPSGAHDGAGRPPRRLSWDAPDVLRF